MPDGFLTEARMLAVNIALRRHHCPGIWREQRDEMTASTQCRRCGVTVVVTNNVTDADLEGLWPLECKGTNVNTDEIPRDGGAAKKAGRRHSRLRVSTQSRLAAHGSRNHRGSN